jgi:hypothetical protein
MTGTLISGPNGHDGDDASGGVGALANNAARCWYFAVMGLCLRGWALLGRSPIHYIFLHAVFLYLIGTWLLLHTLTL